MNTIRESNLLQAISLAIQLCEVREMEMVKRQNSKQHDFKSTYRKGLEDVLDRAIKGEPIVIVD
jgi:hypothetical protein